VFRRIINGGVLTGDCDGRPGRALTTHCRRKWLNVLWTLIWSALPGVMAGRNTTNGRLRATSVSESGSVCVGCAATPQTAKTNSFQLLFSPSRRVVVVVRVVIARGLAVCAFNAAHASLPQVIYSLFRWTLCWTSRWIVLNWRSKTVWYCQCRWAPCYLVELR